MRQKRPDRFRGPGHDIFWAWCDKGELRLQQCASCGKFTWPAAQACEYCGSTELAWQPMLGRGKIVSWCTFEHDYYQGMLSIPWETILVELEEGPLFLSNPAGLTWKDIHVDMAVKLVFLDCEESAGAFRLPVFEKV